MGSKFTEGIKILKQEEYFSEKSLAKKWNISFRTLQNGAGKNLVHHTLKLVGVFVIHQKVLKSLKMITLRSATPIGLKSR